MRVSDQERFRMVNALGGHTDVSRKMRGYRRCGSTLSCTYSVADGAAAFEQAVLL